MVLSEDEIKQIVNSYKDVFTQCWRSGFTEYVTKYQETRLIHSPLARAVLIRDHCIDQVKRSFASHPHVSLKTKNGLFVVEMSGIPVGINGSIVAKLKKLNPRMLASNIPTNQSLAFDEQKVLISIPVQLPLFGEPITIVHDEPTHINIGYLPDNLWLMFEGVYVTLPNGKGSIKWFSKISDDVLSNEVPVIVMPVQRVTNKPKRVHVKKQSGTLKKLEA